MADTSTRMFNGTTLTFGTAISRLVSFRYRCGGVTVDVSEPEDLNKLFETGQDDLEVTAGVKRMPPAVRGTKASLVVAFANGDAKELPGTWIVTEDSGGGQEDAPITGDITFKPTVPVVA